MRMFIRNLKSLSYIVLFFFLWTFGPLFQIPTAIAAGKPRVRNADFGMRNEKQKTATSGERFEKALEDMRENVRKADDREAKGESVTSELAVVKAKRAEIETLDADLRKQFSATEKKLKDANLPKEILDRHYAFVKHYEENLKELTSNLDDVEKTKSDRKSFKAALDKAMLQLEKTKAPSRHIPLDPNNLPNRLVKGKRRAPRLKKEDFEKEFGPQKTKGTRTADYRLPTEVSDAEQSGWMGIADSALRRFSLPLAAPASSSLLAFNGPAGDMPLDFGSQPGTANRELSTDLPDLAFSLNTDLSILNLATVSAVEQPTADDLAETPEVQFTPELLQIATVLKNNPVWMYEFVRNNFAFDPYYGSVKGSQGTLLLQSGNDFDQASVLIALFRVSGIPARYVYGTVEIPIEKAMRWLGGITDPLTAGLLLATNGIPAKLEYSGGKIKSLILEHVWTEVYIPYANYRGLINDPAAPKSWISLDPSFKLIDTNNNAADMADLQNFNADSYLMSYLQTVKPTTPAKDYLATTINYVTNNLPGQSFFDLLSSGPIEGKELGLLPDTLSYTVSMVGAIFAEVPDTYRHRVTLELSRLGTGSTMFTYSVPWSELLYKRFTLSYVPATPADEQVTAIYGNIYSTPPYLLQVKPVLKVEGDTVEEGTAIGMGENIMVKMSFIDPQGTVDKIVQNNLTAGATHAIGLGSGYTTGRVITYRAAKLETAAKAGDVGEPIVGEYLNLFAMNYLQELDSSRKLVSRSMRILDTFRLAELMVGVDLGVSRVFGLPEAVSIDGLLMDVDYNIATPVDMDGNQSKVRRFQILAGMTSSALEHNTFEAITGIEGISTIKALEIANTEGIPVVQVDASNIASQLASIQLSSSVIGDIQNAVSAGKLVIVSERNVQLNNWNGVGYIVLDPSSGAGAYMISSDLAGGALSWITSDLQYMISTGQMTAAQAKAWILAHRKKIWFPAPVEDPITSPFGRRSIGAGFHNGIDFGASIKTPVYAVASGTVTRSEYSQSYGNVIYIDNGGGVETRYAHNCTIYPPLGRHVELGDLIALSGNTGHIWSSALGAFLPETFPRCVSEEGAHVHFEIRLNGESIDPQSFLMIQ